MEARTSAIMLCYVANVCPMVVDTLHFGAVLSSMMHTMTEVSLGFHEFSSAVPMDVGKLAV